MIRLKRAYEPPGPSDGRRILVERLWPRGLRKDTAHIDVWIKEVAPSAELRKWFSHDSDKWGEFRKRYQAELRGNGVPVEQLEREARQRTVTFVYAARDEEHNSALVLKQFLERRMRSGGKGRAGARLDDASTARAERGTPRDRR